MPLRGPIYPMRHVYISLVASLLLAPPAFAQPKSAKRGIAYGQHTAKDMEALSAGISWWYNWYHQPELEVYDAYNVDFVPMAWNGAFDKVALRNFLLAHPDVKYILGWNEPNFTAQANMTPSQAAAQWPDIEALADEFDLEIVGPAVNYCDVCVSENGVTYTDPVKYLDDFFAACSGCRVDHIAIHGYMGDVAGLQWFVNLFKKYEKPIWLTEFANWENSPTVDDLKNYMVGAVDYLENNPDIFRYAWFTGRRSEPPYIGLLQSGAGVLSELGQVYVNMPLHNADHYTAIPARMEAEQYNSMSGILLELTEDTDGFANVGYIEANDWLEYGIDVPEAGVYYLSLRVASTQASSIYITSGGTYIITAGIANSNGWQNWQTVTVPVTLAAGKQIMRLVANTAGFNLNWLELSKEVVLSEEELPRQPLALHPNPAESLLTITSPGRLLSVEIVDMLGKPCYRGTSPTVDVAALAAGTYAVRTITASGVQVNRLVKK